MHPDDPVPPEQELACALWKSYHTASYGLGDGSVTWWTLQPLERSWWVLAARQFSEVYDVKRRA